MLLTILPLLALFLLSSARDYDMECLWCINVVCNTRDNFGNNIVNATNAAFEAYFTRTCLLDRMKSVLLAAVCYKMYHDYRDTLFNDLRNNATVLQTCSDCGFCR
ncbi:hypothetical protein NECAME_06066 [Necator americanus]|uniref:Saposin B-type domain-containing protein n=1 Tax=Necator americanus TaxID=51031 RepID=W2TW57_NECAM|nr:hypothetical protein NECAME_06066 [Necator americanus]ETN86093.1 hypothetical protein NECAME_06066 [Necator americanus]